MKIPPSSLPTYDILEKKLCDGAAVHAPKSCHQRILGGDERCIAHYSSIVSNDKRFHQCPHGLTTLATPYRGRMVFSTAVVATPRFGTKNESEEAKKNPGIRISRSSMLGVRAFYEETERELEIASEQARKNLPQALHELRKLNKIVKDAVDNELEKFNHDASRVDGASQNDLRSIEGAAQIMSNIFEVVEALANIESLSVIKMDEHIALYDLAYKAKRIYQVRARLKPIHIQVNGDESAAILGSKKSFPIVLTVLLENAIKYGRRDSVINIEVNEGVAACTLIVKNKSDSEINPETCFSKGVRFGKDDSEGSGLGLYLASEVVIAHKGNIRCSKDGDVVSMRVEIPSYPVNQGAAPRVRQR